MKVRHSKIILGYKLLMDYFFFFDKMLENITSMISAETFVVKCCSYVKVVRERKPRKRTLFIISKKRFQTINQQMG